jgi:hypothetical protein
MFVTSADDNKLKVWDMYDHRCQHTSTLEATPGKKNPIGIGASTLAITAPN